MGPRSKQSGNDLILCDMCGCLFVNKDGQTHAGLCNADRNMKVFLTEDGCNDNSYNYHKCPHGLLFDQTLIGIAEEIKIKDVAENIVESQRNRMIQLNPTIMTQLEISIGRPVIVNKYHVFLAWPCLTVSPTTVRITKKVMEEIDYVTGDMVIVQAITSPVVDAQTICCSISNSEQFDSKLQSLHEYFIRTSVGIYVRSGCKITIDYYGQPCVLHITQIQGVDGSETESRQTDNIHSLSDHVQQLHLTPNPPSSTPVKSSSRIDSNSSEIPRFYQICHRTKMVVSGDEERNRERRDIGPTLADIGGYNQQIQTINHLITSHLFQSHLLIKQGLASPGGILLYGPSGVGKTHLIKAIANQLPVHFITINGSEIWSKFYGESEAKLISMFQEAESRAPSIVFLDEIDAFCPKRELSKNELEKRVVSTLLTLLDKLSSSKKGVFIVGATSRRQDIDGALRRPGRLDREIELGVPTVHDRTKILNALLCRTQHNINQEVVKDLAERAHGFLASDLTALCKEATLHAVKKATSDTSSQLMLDGDDLVYGFQMVKPSAMKEVTLEISKVSWSDIGGQEELKLQLKQAVEWPLKHPEAFSRLGIRPPRGLLMYGPPGCSKTMIAKALAKESGLNFIAIKGPELFSKWVGESERAVREVFHRARAAAPAIVFFDEIDALAGERGGNHGGGGDVSDRVLAQLLTEMDGVQALEDILVVAATNRPDLIDKALMRPGRLDRIVYVPLPDSITRHAIFSIQWKKMPVAEDVSIDDLVTHTEGYSGAEVSALCHEAALAALQENISSDSIQARHFTAALLAVKPRITPQLIALYDKYRMEGSTFH